jgi:hypothetical protein
MHNIGMCTSIIKRHHKAHVEGYEREPRIHKFVDLTIGLLEKHMELCSIDEITDYFLLLVRIKHPSTSKFKTKLVSKISRDLKKLNCLNLIKVCRVLISLGSTPEIEQLNRQFIADGLEPIRSLLKGVAMRKQGKMLLTDISASIYYYWTACVLDLIEGVDASSFDLVLQLVSNNLEAIKTNRLIVTQLTTLLLDLKYRNSQLYLRNAAASEALLGLFVPDVVRNLQHFKDHQKPKSEAKETSVKVEELVQEVLGAACEVEHIEGVWVIDQYVEVEPQVFREVFGKEGRAVDGRVRLGIEIQGNTHFEEERKNRRTVFKMNFLGRAGLHMTDISTEELWRLSLLPKVSRKEAFAAVLKANLY